MAIGLHNLKPAEGSTHRKKRLGRGIGSGHGKTSGRGHKGNKARGQVNPNFEGGQTPLHRRLPEKRGVGKRNPHGFHNLHKTEYALVSIKQLDEQFQAGDEVTPDTLLERHIIRNLRDGVKVLGDGEVGKALNVKAHRFSRSAQEKLTAAGGTLETLAALRR